MEERLDGTATAVLEDAAERARGAGRRDLTAPDLWESLLGRPAPAQLLSDSGIDVEQVRARVARYGRSRTARRKDVVELSLREALRLGRSRIDDVALLLAVLRDVDGGERPDGEHQRALDVLDERSRVAGGPVPGGPRPARQMSARQVPARSRPADSTTAESTVALERRLASIEAKLDVLLARLPGS